MRKPAPKGPRTAPATAKATTRTAAERSAARSTERPAARAASRANAAGPADRPARRPAIRRPAPAPVKTPAKPAARPAAPRAKSAGQERLQKILAAAGIVSRRACEQIILWTSCSLDISRLKMATAFFVARAPLTAMLRARAVLPMEGRAAMMTRSLA